MKNNKGVTLIALAITIVVMTIIAGISVYSGTEMIGKAQLEELRTNMLLVEAKAREYVEEVNFKMGISPDEAKKEEAITEIYIDKAKMKKANDSSLAISVPEDSGINLEECYCLTDETFANMGLEKMEREEGEYYLIKFNEEDVSVEIYNTEGFKSKDGTIYYSLTDLENINE